MKHVLLALMVTALAVMGSSKAHAGDCATGALVAPQIQYQPIQTIQLQQVQPVVHHVQTVQPVIVQQQVSPQQYFRARTYAPAQPVILQQQAPVVHQRQFAQVQQQQFYQQAQPIYAQPQRQVFGQRQAFRQPQRQALGAGNNVLGGLLSPQGILTIGGAALGASLSGGLGAPAGAAIGAGLGQIIGGLGR
jgi:hypothetical protein